MFGDIGYLIMVIILWLPFALPLLGLQHIIYKVFFYDPEHETSKQKIDRLTKERDNLKQENDSLLSLNTEMFNKITIMEIQEK